MNYKDLIVWQKAHSLAVKVIRMAGEPAHPPGWDIVARQLVRAATSVSANIAEGYGRHAGKEYEHYLQMAYGSASEVDNWLTLLVDAGLADKEPAEELLATNKEVLKMLAPMLRRLRERRKATQIAEERPDYDLSPLPSPLFPLLSPLFPLPSPLSPLPSSLYLSSRVRAIPPSGIRRFFDLIASLEGVISLGVGEPDFTTPWHIREAAIYSLERGHTMYTSNYGLLELRQALSRHLAGRYSVTYDPRTELLITVGVSEALDLALRAILDPEEEVIIPEPSYVSYIPGTILAGGNPVMVPTRAEDSFKPRPEAIAAKITNRTKALLIGYPNNPTGATMARDELAEIAEMAQRHSLLVISDEIYDRLVYEGEHTCFASLPGMRERTILLGGFSKAYAMTGWRIGYAAAPAEVMEGLLKIHQYSALCAPIMAQKAALEALLNGEADVQAMVQEYNRRRRVMVKGFNGLGLPCFEPTGAFYAFPSIAPTGLSAEEFAERLLLEEKVAVVPGTAFGPSGEGFVRCCYATSLDNIHEALRRIGRFLAKLNG